MDKETLVASDIEIEGAVVAALSRAQIPVTAVDWTWVPQLNEWQLVVVTSLHDKKGPQQTYARIIAALSEAGIYKSVPMRRLFVKSPEDPIAKRLVQEIRTTDEGSVHIVRDVTNNGRQRYAVVFAPYSGTGGAIPSVRLEDEQKLRDFLEKRIGIATYLIDQAASQLATKGSASIFNVRLSLKRARVLKLVA
jgi:hypothetical protein